MNRPPRLLEALLEAALPPDARSDAVLGDLHEEFAERARRSAWRARAWYAREALAVAVRTAWYHERTRRRAGGSRIESIMDQIVFNVRYSVRRLLKSPLFTLVAVVSLGIGANTAMFSLVNAVILRDLPFEDPESLVDLYERTDGFSHGTLSYPDYRDVIEASDGVFTGVSCSQLTIIQTDVDGGVDVATAEAVTGNYFSLVGVKPALGRLFTDEDHVARGAHPVVVLSYGYWQRRFAGAADVVGSELRLGGRPYTVIGVAPERYTGNLRGIVPDVYVPIMMYDELQGSGGNVLEARGNQSLFAKARMAPGATVAQAEGVLERLGTTLRERHPRQWTQDKAFVLVPTADVIMNPMIDRVLVPAAGMVMVVVGLVLLIACANLASFLLARATDRRKEVAVRLAMGARRRTLVAQLLSETVLLSALGGAAGVALAVWALRVLTAADLPLPLPITLDLSLDTEVLAFSVAVSLVAGVLFGLAPALQATNPDVAPTLRDESAGGGRAKGTLLRDVLVAGQMAVSVVLLVGAGLFLRSLDASRSLDPGFGDAPTGVLQIITPERRYDEAESRAFVRRLEERVLEIPGVEAVGAIQNLPLNTLSTWAARVRVDGIEPPVGQDFHFVDFGAIDAGLLDAAGIEIVSGRGIAQSDDADAQPVALVSQTFADRFFPGQDPLGRSIEVDDGEHVVVGVTEDIKVRQIGEAPRPYLYLSHYQSFDRFQTLVARTSGDADRLASGMLAAARDLDPEIMVIEAKTMERHLAVMLVARELGAGVVAGFAALALLLASIGLYGVVSYAVARRGREVGIRMSLGADARTVVWMLTKGGMRLVAVGAVVGLLLAALMSTLLSTLLYGVGAFDAPTFLGVPLILGLVALVASWVPARRATRINPVTALRAD